MKLGDLGIELWVFGDRRTSAADLPAILSCLRDAGYGTVEGLVDLAPAPDLLRGSGLRMLGHHVVPKQLQDLATLIPQLRACGCEDVISSGLLDWHVRTPAAYREAAASLNMIGRALRDAGLRLHYHNHDFEFLNVEGAKTGMDLLLEGFDPACVSLCADVGWVWFAGVDSLAFMREHAARIGVLHLRDFKGKVSETLGRGDIPLEAQLAAARELPNLRWVVVEQDPGCADPLGSMRESRAWLARHWPWGAGQGGGA